VVATNGIGAYNFDNLNGFVANGTLGSGTTIPNFVTPGDISRLIWYPKKAAFRAGEAELDQWDDVNIGKWSVAAGFGTTASNDASVALGMFTRSFGEASLAAGKSTFATGAMSFAMGNFVTATNSTAVAMGFSVTADGSRSMALGNFASTDGKFGSFVFGDGSTVLDTPPQAVVKATANNQFVARTSGGAIFYSNKDLTTGVSLAAGGGSWDTLSDRRMKTNFRALDGEDVLAKLARIPILEWNYISQDASIRHVGPMAQDFRAAFGLGEDERHINTLDPDGISLKAIQALDARTQATRQDVERLTEENAALRRTLEALRQEIDALKASTAPRR
jgi:hypothetical protein